MFRQDEQLFIAFANTWSLAEIHRHIIKIEMTKKRLGVFILIFCIVLIFYQIISTRNEMSTLQTKGKLTVGHTLSFRYVFKSGNRVTYTFTVDNKEYKEEDEKTNLDGLYFEKFKDKNFPVIYDIDNPTINRILLTESDFKLFDIPIPDTLRILVDKTK